MRSMLHRLNLSMSGGALYCTEESLYNDFQAVRAELIHAMEGPCTAQRGPSMVRSTLYRLNLSMSGGALEGPCVLYRGVLLW